eukprot:scaffold51757_cov42-Cyclotella_meneghiniana.AAC.15
MFPILPTTFKQLSSNAVDADTDPKPGRKKNKRGNNGADGGKCKLVWNPEPVEEWQLKDGEEWAWFSGENCKERPTWNGKCKMCHKFYMKDICFDDCPNKESRVPGTKVQGPRGQEEGLQCLESRQSPKQLTARGLKSADCRPIGRPPDPQVMKKRSRAEEILQEASKKAKTSGVTIDPLVTVIPGRELSEEEAMTIIGAQMLI